MTALAHALDRLRQGRHLSLAETSELVDQIMDGRLAEDDVAALLLALRDKGETAEEIAGAAAALRRRMTRIQTRHRVVLDTCGTGGDRSGTFNISTAAALVAAAAGVAVAKHGNRSVTSRSGSADVLAALGVRIDAPVEVVQRCLDELGVCFCFAPLLHPAMRVVAPVRRRLGVRTIFNLVGPLCNPAGAPCQLVGVGQRGLRGAVAEALALLGARRAVVVCGEDGLDEVTLAGPTWVAQVADGRVAEGRWRPEDFGAEAAPIDSLRVDGPDQSAAVIRRVLAGQPGPARRIVVLNAAAALHAARPEQPLRRCAEQAAEAIDSGAAASLLDRWIEASQA